MTTPPPSPAGHHVLKFVDSGLAPAAVRATIPGTMVADQSALDADLWHRSERYFRELGPNAYAVLNVLTDFASHPPENSRMRRDRPTLQRMAGRWLREFRDASKVPGFAMAEHIKGLSPLATEQRTASKMAGAASLAFESLDPRLLHAEISAFNAGFKTISEILFDGHKPSADHYMRKSMETFSTPVFKALGECNQRERLSESVISRMLDIPLVDAREIKSALA